MTKSLSALAALAVLFVAWYFLPVDEWIRAFIAWVSGLGVSGALVFGAVYVVATVLMMPGSPLTIGAGLVFGLRLGFPIVIVSATVGATLAFLVARYLARQKVAARIGDHPRFRAIDDAIAEDGWKVVLLLRLSPLVPFNIQNYLYGLTSIKLSHYVSASFVGMMPGALLYLYIGAVGKAVVDDTGPGGAVRWVFFGVGLVATVAVTVLVTRKARMKLRAYGVESVTTT